MPVPEGYEPLVGSERPHGRDATLVGRVERSEPVAFTVLLHSRPDAPSEPELEDWEADPATRQFASGEEWMQAYGAEEEAVARVVEFLEAKGLRVLERSAGRRRIVAEGDARKVNAAFGITLNRYRRPASGANRGPARSDEPMSPLEDETYRGFEGQAHLPSELIPLVRGVIGLDNRQIGRSAVGSGDPLNSNYLSPDAVARLYNFPNTGAAGQTVGIFEDAGAGAAYLHSDIADFIATLAAGYTTAPVLNDIGLTVGATTYANDPALVTASPSGAALECGVDVSVVAAVAQGANINVYFTDTSEAGWEAFFDRALFPLPGDNPPSALTTSWFYALEDDKATIGDPTVSGTASNLLHGYLRTAAHRGITVLMAIGDWGSADLDTDGKCHVSYPPADPWATACGGTIVGNITATGFEEFTWSDAGTASQFQNFPYVSTGGGVSDTFPVPPFQRHAHLSPISNNDGNARRGVPDVAGMVAMDGFFFAGVGGPGQQGVIGTSLVAPLYAGLVAVLNGFINRDAGFLNPILYRHGSAICRDVRFGNNDSGNGPVPPDAPFYLAGPGWDRCTGWGSIDGTRLRAALVPAPILVSAIAGDGYFGTACLGSFVDRTITINNTGFSLLLISDITSSSSDFQIPTVGSYPLAVAAGTSIEIPVRYQPSSFGASAATLTIYSNDLLGPETVSVSATCGSPRAILAIADEGNFGNVCVGSVADESLIVNNSGTCPLTITDISSSAAEFEPPETLSYPVTVAPGGFLPVPIRFSPTGFGAVTATLTVTSDDPAGPRSIGLRGNAPSGKLAVSGSTDFGEVDCGFAERTVAICNVGDCALEVTSVEFARPRRHFKLISNPFPATLRPGSCLGVVIRYEASCDPECCELVIRSNDPSDSVRRLDVIAYTRCRPVCECKPAPCGCESKHGGGCCG
jgi:Pro-kumamolisin, activation domain/Abnormal spindle-like microcephaly-assoc'd, ASPM-SPD-2-Hydin